MVALKKSIPLADKKLISLAIIVNVLGIYLVYSIMYLPIVLIQISTLFLSGLVLFISHKNPLKISKNISFIKKLEMVGILTLIIFVFSCFTPWFSIGTNNMSLLKIASENVNVDWLGALILITGSLTLIISANHISASLLSIIGICFPLFRLYRITTISVDMPSAFSPSFGIGGYLILIGAGIQLYACFSFTNENKNISNTDSSDNENSSDDITEKIEKLFNLKDKGALTEEEFDTKKKELLDRV